LFAWINGFFIINTNCIKNDHFSNVLLSIGVFFVNSALIMFDPIDSKWGSEK